MNKSNGKANSGILSMGGTTNSENPTSSPEGTARVSDSKKTPYMDAKFAFTNAILVLIALVAAYLQYDVYPAIMTKSPFYETNITLHLSIFTFTYDSTRCTLSDTTVSNCSAAGGTVVHILGVPAFDFFQLFIAMIILANIYHFWTRR
jgi:hypothetical protein